MVNERRQRILGWGALGLFVGVMLFAFYYAITYRAGLTVPLRGQWLWVFVHLLVLLGPAAGFAFYGASRKPEPT